MIGQLPSPQATLLGPAKCVLCCGIDSARFAWRCSRIDANPNHLPLRSSNRTADRRLGRRQTGQGNYFSFMKLLTNLHLGICYLLLLLLFFFFGGGGGGGINLVDFKPALIFLPNWVKSGNVSRSVKHRLDRDWFNLSYHGRGK